MGTRNTTLVQRNHEYKVGQYCQWDGYPGGQGLTILKALREINIADFGAKVDKLKSLTSEEVQAKWKKCGADDSGWVNMAVSDKFKKKWPHLSRDCGGDIIGLIASGKVKEVYVETDFPADSLFCEWAYVIDLDAGVFEVYRGFNQKPLEADARFYDLQYTDEAVQERVERLQRGGENYYPVKLLTSWPLDQLPTDEEFLAIESDDEDEEETESEPEPAPEPPTNIEPEFAN